MTIGGQSPGRRALVPVLLGLCAALACSPDTRPDVLLITVDTLRADRTGFQGYPGDTTPQLDRLAERGVRFLDCTVQWPKTWPSMASFLTGAYPRTTGLRIRPRVIPPSLILLPEIFADAGYRTAAVVANVNVGRQLGFDQGFEVFIESWRERAAAALPRHVKRFTNARLVNDQALDWVAALPPDRPLLLWLHYIDPHGPYEPPDDFLRVTTDRKPEPVPLAKIPQYQLQHSEAGEPVTDLADYKDRYDGEIRYLDSEIGRLIERLDALRHRRRLIAVTADHGESLGEHDYYLDHGQLPYQPSAHVPAILVLEGTLPPGRVVERPVGLIDLARTIVEVAGLAPPATFEGSSLLALAQGRAGTGPEYVFMESGYSGLRPQRTVRRGRWKLIRVGSPRDRRSMTGREFELYDLRADPEESRNLASEHPQLLAELAGVLDAFVQGARPTRTPPEAETGSIGGASRRLLRELGYLANDTP